MKSSELDEKLFNDEIYEKSKQSKILNAFHIISLAKGFDLLPLFDEKKKEEKEEIRFATTSLRVA